MPIPIIARPAGITAEWLTAVLRESGQGGKVQSFTAQTIGTGQVGENVRFTLEGKDVPASVVGKFPSADPISRQTGIGQQNYLREVYFYRTIRHTVDVQTPKVWFADADQDTHDFVIVMEDLAPGAQGDQLAGCSADHAALAMTQLARLQGPRWGDTGLQSQPLLWGGHAADKAPNLQAFYRMLMPGFLARYADRLSAEEIDLVDRVGHRLLRYHDAYSGPLSLIHIDYRLDNMMFGGPYPLAIVDWQSISIGCPLIDASYFMGTSLDPVLRRVEEKHLIRQYLGTLASYGADLDFEDCFKVYRNYAPAGLVMAVIASMIVGETERGNDMFMAMAQRSMQMCRDLDALDV